MGGVERETMSVLKSKRGESSMQFLETAYNLEVFTIKQVVKFPKRYTFFIGTEIVSLASGCHNKVKAANSIYPTDAHEVQMRRDYLISANCDLQNLLSKLDIAKWLFPLESHVLENWVSMIVEESKLISGVKQADKRRYSALV